MNREETLALYQKAKKEGRKIWNAWANSMLSEKERLKDEGSWESKNQEWQNKAKADFSTKENPHTFSEPSDFSGFIFPSHVLFEFAIFEEKANFTNAIFSGEANFQGTVFNGWTTFYRTSFVSSSWFYRTTFNKDVIFSNAIFIKESYFRYATFNKYSNYDGAKFIYGSSFEYSLFSDKISFINASFRKRVNFSSTNFKNQAVFDYTTFHSEILFTAIRCNGSFSLNKSKFLSEIPNFNQAHFVESPRLDNLQIGSPPQEILSSPYHWQRYFWQEKSLAQITRYWKRRYDRYTAPWWNKFRNANRDPEDEAKYRALKRLAIQAHDHENEQKFWAGEIRARRHIKDFINPFKKGPASTVRYIGGVFYALLSDFGRSIWRPVIFWSVLVHAMTCVHLSAHKHLQNPPTPQETARVKYPSDPKPDCNPSWSALHVSLKTSSLGLGFDRTKSEVYKDHYRCLYPAKNSSLKIPDNILIYEFVQMLISAVLIFLLLLGIRNNFKLK